MFVNRKRFLVAALLFTAAMLFPPAGPALAALDEKPVLDDINDTIAVLHGFFRRIIKIEQNLEMVRASYQLTKSQYAAQKKLYESEKAKGREKRAALMKPRLDRLKRQMVRIEEFNFEEIYNKRIAELRKQIALVKLDLDTRITEYQTLFGKTPHVDLDFDKRLQYLKSTRKDLGHYLNLD